MSNKFIIVLLSFLLIASCSVSDDKVYTLYRNSPVSGSERVHVATFDADEDEVYNRVNCQIAEELFQKQPFVQVKYWCEKGRYRK